MPEDHLFIECAQFMSKIPSNVSSSSVSRSCMLTLNSGHASYECHSRKVCKNCRKHHTLSYVDSIIRDKPTLDFEFETFSKSSAVL